MMDELYLDNIDEFINDQNKVVTYKWLSLTLGVHVNLAKQMLFHYLDKRRKESSTPLHATYLVSGKFVENGNMSHKVSVVREDQLEHVKSKMSLTVSVHVYSVQKALLKDSGPLYSVDYDAVKDNLNICSKYSAIRCASAVPLSSPEVHEAYETASTSQLESENARPNGNGSASSIAKPATKQPKGIMGMFSRSVAKSQVSTKEAKVEQKEETSVVEESKGRPASKTSAMSNFFGKQPQKKVDAAVKEEGGRDQSPSSLVEKRPPSPPLEVAKERDTQKDRPKQDAVDKDLRSKTKRLEDSDSEEEGRTGNLKKKRRRIKKPQPDSSDDEAISESPRLEDVRNPSPIPDEEVKKSELFTNKSSEGQRSEVKRSEGNSRKRRRVLKSHTFLDDEGCIVTEKCYESESYSETEDVVHASKPTPKNETLLKSTGKKEPEKKHKKVPTNANLTTKQASIMGFFQKK